MYSSWMNSIFAFQIISNEIIVASKHSLISVIEPLPDRDESYSASAVVTEQLQKSEKDQDEIFEDLGQGGVDSLGPITERFMVVKRGMDVVLECRDPDGGAEVLWRKQGGKRGNITLL